MIHKFNLSRDVIQPLLRLIVGKKHDCCDHYRNCAKCYREHGWTE